jgi:deazaflavin-dependent oxidoreductase (nitroreductase family)
VESSITHSHRGGRVLSAVHLPFFQLRPPRDYGILTATGRRTGKRRSRCLRIVRAGDHAYLVAIRGEKTSRWAQNVLANPDVGLRLPGGRFRGRARQLRDEERESAREAYSANVGWFERFEYRIWRDDAFTAEKSRELHREWFDTGTPIVVDIARSGD